VVENIKVNRPLDLPKLHHTSKRSVQKGRVGCGPPWKEGSGGGGGRAVGYKQDVHF